MAAIRKRETKDGTVYYEIAVSRGRGRPRPTTQWYPPSNWSKKSVERELTKVAAAFEQAVKAGQVVTHKEKME